MLLRKYLIIIKVSISNTFTYRANLLSRFCFYSLFVYIFMNLWHAIYEKSGVNGYTHTQIVWYLILTEFISFACRTNIHNEISNDVKTGAIGYQIGRPVHYIFFHFASSIGQMVVNAAIFGGFAFILGIVSVGKLSTFTVLELPALLLSITLSTIINYFLLIIIGISAFIVEDNFAMYLIYQKLGFMLGMFMPVEFLPEWFQPIAKMLPFSYIYWAPAKIFVNYSTSIVREVIPRQFFWVLLSVILAVISFNKSLKYLQVNGG